VRVNACEHLVFSIPFWCSAAGRAQASQGDTSCFPTPLSSVNSPDDPPGGNYYREPRAMPGSKRLSLPDGSADPDAVEATDILT
jgi:hypothetical protein